MNKKKKDFKKAKKYLIKRIQAIKYVKGNVLNLNTDFELDEYSRYYLNRLEYTGRVDIHVSYFNPDKE